MKIFDQFNQCPSAVRFFLERGKLLLCRCRLGGDWQIGFALVPGHGVWRGGRDVRVQSACAVERCSYIGADVFRANVLFKLGLFHELGGLWRSAAQDQSPAGSMDAIGQIFQSANSGGVNRGHVAQANDDDGGQLRNALYQFIHLVGGAKQEWPVDAENGDVRRNFLVLQDVNASLFHICVGNLGDGCGVGDFSDEDQSSHDHAGLNRYGEIGENSKEERCRPCAGFKARELQQFRDFRPLAHVVRNHQQDCRQHGKWNVTGQRRGENDNRQKSERMNHACYGGFGAGSNVGGRARDCAGGGQSTNKRREEVCEALSNQFDIGIVLF